MYGSSQIRRTSDLPSRTVRDDSAYAEKSLTPISVIINADDLGINDEVNEAIFDLLARNKITSTTVLANGPRLKEAAASAHFFTGASFGVHLNLTQFEPLTRGLGPHLPTIRTLSSRNRIQRLAVKPVRLRAVYEEWCCQVDRVFSQGFSVSHIDSHHHIHTAPSLFPALKAVQRRFGIRKVRISRNVYPVDFKISPTLAISKRAFNWALKRIYATRTTDAFTDFVTFCNGMNTAGNRSFRTIELVVHPGSAGSTEESQLLESQWRANIAGPVILIPYQLL
jgi:chitin disaccharide deacetylase